MPDGIRSAKKIQAEMQTLRFRYLGKEIETKEFDQEMARLEWEAEQAELAKGKLKRRIVWLLVFGVCYAYFYALGNPDWLRRSDSVPYHGCWNNYTKSYYQPSFGQQCGYGKQP